MPRHTAVQSSTATSASLLNITRSNTWCSSMREPFHWGNSPYERTFAKCKSEEMFNMSIQLIMLTILFLPVEIIDQTCDISKFTTIVISRLRLTVVANWLMHLWKELAKAPQGQPVNDSAKSCFICHFKGKINKFKRTLQKADRSHVPG